MLKRKIEPSEMSIVKLQAHTERGTCTRDARVLRFVAKDRNKLRKERGRAEIRKRTDQVSLSLC